MSVPKVNDIDAMRTDEIVVALDEDTLVGIVMRLTGGTANPRVVRGQIHRIRAEAGHHSHKHPAPRLED